MLLTKIYCQVDDFCKDFKKMWKEKFLMSGQGKIQKVRQSKLCLSEVMTIVIFFHLSKYRTFKDYYNHLSRKDFGGLVSYNRFLELMSDSLLPILLFMKSCRAGTCTGISFIDSTTIAVCRNQRIRNHRVFEGLAKRGKSSMGWFYGFKLHLVVNDRGEILNFVLSPGNSDDRKEKLVDKLTQRLFGKLFGDRGYISKELFGLLFGKGIQLITRLKRNMKNVLMPLEDKILLRKRAIIETIIDQLKNICQIEHSRHRSPVNFLVNLFSGLVAYSYQEKKPSLQTKWSKKELQLLAQSIF